MQAVVGVGQPHRRGIVMNVCGSPLDGGSGHDRRVSDNGADKWVMMGYANRCGGMQKFGWWLFTSMGHKQGTCCFAAVETSVVGDCCSEAIATGRIGMNWCVFCGSLAIEDTFCCAFEATLHISICSRNRALSHGY